MLPTLFALSVCTKGAIFLSFCAVQPIWHLGSAADVRICEMNWIKPTTIFAKSQSTLRGVSNGPKKYFRCLFCCALKTIAHRHIRLKKSPTLITTSVKREQCSVSLSCSGCERWKPLKIFDNMLAVLWRYFASLYNFRNNNKATTASTRKPSLK